MTRVYSSLAVIDVVAGRFVLREKLASMTMDDVQALTGAVLHLDRPVADLTVPEI